MESSLTKSPGPSSRSKVLPPEFYLRDTAIVARDLIGKGLVRRVQGTTLVAEIVETEAYLGVRDPASHAYKGVRPRNWAMFEAGGTCYVYRSYGIHFCMNVSTRDKGIGEAVLLRAAIPLAGIDLMRKNRAGAGELHLLSGPGKLCQAMAIDLDQNGLRFDRPDLRLVDLGRKIPEKAIGKSPRIGISKAKDELLRFYLKGSPWLSRKG